jgi:hypothetical protein
MHDPAQPMPPDTTALLLGRLEGRLQALEERMDRYEMSTAAHLNAIDAKLDALAATLAQGLGGMRVAHWIGAAILAVSGYIASHLWH